MDVFTLVKELIRREERRNKTTLEQYLLAAKNTDTKVDDKNDATTGLSSESFNTDKGEREVRFCNYCQRTGHTEPFRRKKKQYQKQKQA